MSMAVAVLKHDVDLGQYNSFGFAARAESFVRVESLVQLQEAVALARQNRWPMLVLGGGSNLVLREQIPGLVIQMGIGGRKAEQVGKDEVLVTLGAGESWHRSLIWMLDQGYYGLENLALIPGTVGAAPMQNIGAYGVELEQNFESLQALDTETGEVRHFDREACRFGYRDSYFKSGAPGRYIILEVCFRLSQRPQPVLGYQVLVDELQARGVAQPHPRDLFEVVCAIRRSKLPDPAEVGNAGSFFKNPLVSRAQYQKLLQQYPALVAYPAGEDFKLAAGWLIDQCGWKGEARGTVGVYGLQALVLVNLGAGTAVELMRLADDIVASVEARFGVTLEMEPRLYPA
jgi:UDP-N-acetylmuramate dehydrogenase